VADRVQGLADLRGLRVALRQPGAGASALLDRLLAEAGLSTRDLNAAPAPARTESEAAAAVASGEADAALGIETMARLHGLAFLPLTWETFDLLIDRRAYFLPPVQTLLAFAQGSGFAVKAKAMGGYDLAPLGRVRWVSS
jgi:molybdate-binding protein